MILKEPEEFLKAYYFIEADNFEETLQLLNQFDKKKARSPEDQLSAYILKSRLLNIQWHFNLSRKYAKKAYQLSQLLEKSVHIFEMYLEMISKENHLSNIELALDYIDKAENLLKNLNSTLPKIRKAREAELLWQKGFIYYNKGEIRKAQKYAEQALALREEVDSKTGIAQSFHQLCSFYIMMGEFDVGLKYLKQGLKLSEKINYKHLIPAFYNSYGIYYSFKGELDPSLKYYKKALFLANDLKMRYLVSSIMNNMGLAYHLKGNLDDAQELFEKSLMISQDLDVRCSTILDSLFHLSLEKNDFNSANEYLEQLKNLKDRDSENNIIYLIDKAVMLKTSTRARNRVKAEEILIQVIEERNANYEMKIIALINLCDLLLFELKQSNDLEILNEIKPRITQLLNLAEKNHSYSLIAETLLLRAKMSLLTFDIKQSRQLLSEAQNIAEKYKLHRIAIKISNEHDEFLKQLKKWENLKNSDSSLIERLEMANVYEQMEHILRNRELENPDLSDEDPIVLFIISEGGKPVFSEIFAKEWSFEDHLFGGFLTALNAFSEEMFSEGFERAKFGNHTLIMKSVPPFIVCYLFKGTSYIAQQKILRFINEIQRNEAVWQTFRKSYQVNKEIQLKDIPSLEPLVKEIFVDKAIP